MPPLRAVGNDMNEEFELLNAGSKDERLGALKELMKKYGAGKKAQPSPTSYVNNHIHTSFSFSPYSPTCALFAAWASGLSTAGIMDHDSVGGAEEFLEAGRIVSESGVVSKIKTTCGFEQRVSFASTPFAGKRLNNPDQLSIGYVALHGIPHMNFGLCEEYLAPLRERRNARDVKMIEKVNALAAPFGLSVSKNDVFSLSETENGGSVTERHVLFALALKICAAFDSPEKIIGFFENDLKAPVSDSNRKKILENRRGVIEYDVLGVLKSGLIKDVYVDATDECPDVRDFLAFAKKCGGISAYAYLGDVGDSVTGDKKAQKFEDDYLDDLVPYLKGAGFDAITYMPSRNTYPQLSRLMKLCEKYGLFQISGEDINSPRQSFTNDKVLSPEYRHLEKNTYALIGHEKLASKDVSLGMFSDRTVKAFPDLAKRIDFFASAGRE